MNPGAKSLEELTTAEKRALLASVLEKRNVEPRLVPASFPQERLWFLDQLQPGASIYNMPSAIRLPGPVSASLIGRCINEIVRRHDTLRTTFQKVEGRPFQQIAPLLDVSVPIIDLESFPSSQRELEAQRLAAVEAHRPFDLAKGPLVRAALLRLAPADHVLLLTLHHIISDGWSMGVLLQELSVLYEAYSSGRPSPLAELAIQYADFAQWQRQWLQGEVLDQHRQWWCEQLRGAPAQLELPADHPRPGVATFRGAVELFQFTSTLSEALKQLSQREGVTLFMILLAAFQTLLARYTGQSDIVVGTPIANRTRSELEPLIGFFVNTLVLRTDLGGNPSFRELLARVRENTLGAYAHQDLPFEKLVEDLQPERSLSRNPMFQVMLVLQNAPWAGGRSSTARSSVWPTVSGTAKFDLTLFVMDTADGLLCALEFSTDLFDAERIRLMSGHFRTLLEGVALNPNLGICDLPLLTEVERRQLLDWNSTASHVNERCLHQLFEAQVERTPEAVALVAEGFECTYRELNESANRLAHYLRKQGIGPESLVGICLERVPEMIVTVLAVLKAGGAYVPIDPGYPEERRRFMFDDSGCVLLVTRDRLQRDAPAIESESGENPVNRSTLDNLVYVIYTSGSTGQPKGVAMPGRPLASLIVWHLQRFPVSFTTLQFAPLSFDVSFQEMFATLCAGGVLRLCSDEVRRDPRRLHQFIEEAKIERIFLPCVALQQLASAALPLNTSAMGLRQVITAGEQLQITPQILRLLRGGCSLYNQYGPTETHVVTEFELDGDPNTWMALPPIGRPIPNVQVFVLDERLNLLPVGVIGELYIGGALARGYLRRSQLTAERFVPSPFAKESGERLYRTGDLVRYRADGNIEFVERRDNQIKIRGYRVELGEIETVLAAHPGVKAAAIAARGWSPGDRRLVAYVVPSTPDVSLGSLQEFLSTRLPDYMIPAALVTVDAFPLTPSGKVDRSALPDPDGQRPELSRQFVAPRTSLELELAAVWSRVLETTPIGVHDNFFDLGGHSLLATTLVSRLREVFEVDVPVQRVFASPTIAEMSCAIVELQLQGHGEDAAGLVANFERQLQEREEHA